jgi:hypothetical protein
MQELAVKLYDQGIVTVPFSTTEHKPVIDAGLNLHQQHPSRDVFLAMWAKAAGRADGIAVVTGEIECIDGDTKNDPKKNIHERLLGMLMDNLPAATWQKLFVERSRSGGCHVWYRVRKTEIIPGQALAKVVLTPAEMFDMDEPPEANPVKIIVENRADGNLCTVWPSPGYSTVQPSAVGIGKHPLESLPILTTEERELVLMIARSFNEYDPPAVTYNYPVYQSNQEGNRPGDYFNRGTSPEDLVRLLENAGYRTIRTFGKHIYLNRPGARHSRKCDAEVNTETNRFIPYSSSISEFENAKATDPFGVYVKLVCKGDFAEATRQVAQKGFEDPEKKGRKNGTVNYPPGAVPIHHVADPFATKPENDVIARLAHLRFSLDRRPKDVDYNFFFVDPDNPAILQPVGFPGALIPIYGAAKSRKTTLLGMIVAAALCNGPVMNVVYRNTGKILWIDTEQGEMYYWETLWRVHVQARRRSDDQENFYSYTLIDMSPAERLAEVHNLVDAIQPSILILDGIIDFMGSMNDEDQAKEMIQILRGWTSRRITVFPVLHFNPGSQKGRGHAGTFLTNKGDTIIAAFADPLNNKIMSVKNQDSRGMQFSAFDMVAGRDGILTVSGYADYDYTIAKPERKVAEVDVNAAEDVYVDEPKALPEYNPNNINAARVEPDSDIPF